MRSPRESANGVACTPPRSLSSPFLCGAALPRRCSRRSLLIRPPSNHARAHERTYARIFAVRCVDVVHLTCFRYRPLSPSPSLGPFALLTACICASLSASTCETTWTVSRPNSKRGRPLSIIHITIPLPFLDYRGTHSFPLHRPLRDTPWGPRSTQDCALVAHPRLADAVAAAAHAHTSASTAAPKLRCSIVVVLLLLYVVHALGRPAARDVYLYAEDFLLLSLRRSFTYSCPPSTRRR